MRRAGFTIIELLVAFTIGMMLIIGGTMAANSFNARQKVDAAVDQITEVVSLAKNYAMTRQKPTSSYTRAIEYVVVIIDATGNIYVYPGNNSQRRDTVSYLHRNINPSEVTVTGVADGGLIFSVPEGKLVDYREDTTIPHSSSDVTITVALAGDPTNSKIITIEPSGLIR